MLFLDVGLTFFAYSLVHSYNPKTWNSETVKKKNNYRTALTSKHFLITKRINTLRAVIGPLTGEDLFPDLNEYIFPVFYLVYTLTENYN